jgi:hypothetical protein
MFGSSPVVACAVGANNTQRKHASTTFAISVDLTTGAMKDVMKEPQVRSGIMHQRSQRGERQTDNIVLIEADALYDGCACRSWYT